MNILTSGTNTIWLFVMLIILIMPFNGEALESPEVINLSPKQCVALNEGSLCYVDIEISWSVEQLGDFCLFSSQQDAPIKCWDAQQTGTIEREIVAMKDLEFYLKAKGKEVIIGKVKLEMAWVYKKNNRSHSRWRMF
ncbi:MAG: hypothetical protein ACJAVV_000813 [Alphaproteobacteria bacterium]|jgi:hypothetical protein